MVLAELGRKIRNAIGSLSQATIINEDVSDFRFFSSGLRNKMIFSGLECDAKRSMYGLIGIGCEYSTGETIARKCQVSALKLFRIAF